MKSKSTIRNGVTTLELIVSAVLLLAFMTFVTTLCFRTNLVWRDIGHQRIATCELSNQMESLTRLSRDEVEEKLDALEPSEICQRSLNAPLLSGSLAEDDLGVRISLKLEWNRRNQGIPLELVGWLNPSESDNDQVSDSKEGGE